MKYKVVSRSYRFWSLKALTTVMPCSGVDAFSTSPQRDGSLCLSLCLSEIDGHNVELLSSSSSGFFSSTDLPSSSEAVTSLSAACLTSTFELVAAFFVLRDRAMYKQTRNLAIATAQSTMITFVTL